MSEPAEMAPGYGYFEHGADIGVVGRGPTVEEAFIRAAEAMFRVMDEQEHEGGPSRTFRVAFDEDDLELALVTWLNLLLAEARVEGIRPASLTLRRNGSHWEGTASGTPWRVRGDHAGVEVKGATLTMLSVRPAGGGGWEARCVVDV
jgi:SHS2 domain-containing protein